MDEELSRCPGNSVVVTGLGYEVPPAIQLWIESGISGLLPDGELLSHDADPLPFLRVRKTVKFMSKQDRLAMSAAAMAVKASGLPADELELQALIVMGVGPISFQKDEAMQVAVNSSVNGEFSMDRFCREAYGSVNPMLLFACLPNMPAYHISVNLRIRGGYGLTYPSCAENYMAFRNAVCELEEGRVSAVLYGGVADQQNFLVQNHHRKTGQGLPAPDCSCFLVLEKASHARARNAPVLARLQELRIQPGAGAVRGGYYFGPADLPLEVVRLCKSGEVGMTHRLQDNGNLFESVWIK